MKGSRFSEEQIVGVLKETESITYAIFRTFEEEQVWLVKQRA
jgi:hypothetical protein